MKKLALKKPIVLRSKEGAEIDTIAELSFREEIVSGDLRGIKAKALADPSVDDLLTIAGRLCAQPDLVMGMLSIDDMGQVLEVVGSFLSPGEASGTGIAG